MNLSWIIIGLADGMILVLLASGLAMTFGAMRIANFAHGGFFMLGAFLTYSAQHWYGASLLSLVAAMATATVIVALAGLAAERTIYRRLYSFDSVTSLLITFALLLIFEGLIQVIWGNNPLGVNLPPNLQRAAVEVAGTRLPTYLLATIAIAALSMFLLAWFLLRTPVGLNARAIAFDRSMAASLGINVRRTFALTFTIGCALAGLAGSLVSATVSLTSDLGSSYILLAFAVVLVGGVGSIGGAVIAGLLLGLVDTATAIYAASLSGYAVYVVMAAVLLVRPSGLSGRGRELRDL